ncbi:glycosyltransferase [Streptomyces griseorubiginosus]|uniref:glycosyltransferase family 4 protein n=1 Tax=Streptomyces griseorubiginosus TaxID=67304 RepID=UPI0033B1CDFF
MTARTVLLASPCVDPDLGEVEHYVGQLARSLRSRHGCRVVIATTATEGPAVARYGSTGGVPVYGLAVPRTDARTPRGLHWRRGLRRVIEVERVDLVNAHTRTSAPRFADAVARACGDLPFVLTCHAGTVRSGQAVSGPLRARHERTVLARTLWRAHEVVCSSGSAAAGLPDLFAGRSTTILPGVDPWLFAPSPVPDTPLIVFSAPLDRAAGRQGLSDLLRAMGVLSRTVPDVRLEVVSWDSSRKGDSSRNEYERLARRLGLDGHVTFTGRPADQELAAVYRRGRVLVLPTHRDCSPEAVLKAMACGRPVVTPSVDGASPLMTHGDTGLLVAPGDVVGLTEAIGSVLTDHTLARRLGAAGHEQVARELSCERQSDRTVEVFERAAGHGRRTPTVAVVAPNYFPKIGGVENYARRVAHAVAEDPAMRAVVITAHPSRWRTSVGVDGDVPVIRLGTWARHLNTPVSPLWPLQLRRWLRRLGVDLVNAHAPVPGLGDLAVAVSGQRPAVLTYHAGSMVQGHKDVDLLVTAYERYVLPRVFARARVLVASSPVSLAFGRPGAIEITPGVDVDRFIPGPPASTRSRTIVYVGRLDRASPWKGVDVLLRAFAALTDLPDVRLRLLGGGDALPDHMADAERLGIAGRVEFAGRVPADTLLDALRSASVLVLPSQTDAESFGTVLVEAMACGTPVVGSDAGGPRHVITPGVTGLLFPHDDPDALAAACRRLLQDGDLADRMGVAGRRRAVERYAWPALTERYLRLFRSLLPATPAPDRVSTSSSTEALTGKAMLR